MIDPDEQQIRDKLRSCLEGDPAAERWFSDIGFYNLLLDALEIAVGPAASQLSENDTMDLIALSVESLLTQWETFPLSKSGIDDYALQDHAELCWFDFAKRKKIAL